MCEAAREGTGDAVRRFLREHPALRLLPAGDKVRCALTGHELPCRLPELQAYTNGKKYSRLVQAGAGALDYGQYGPHIVPSTKNPAQLFSKLTLRHINRIPAHVLRHVQGRRYQKALRRYEECEKEGTKYIPACMLRKPRARDDPPGIRRQPDRKGSWWEHPSSSDSSSETDDSMSDLYPAGLFQEKKPAAEGRRRSSDGEVAEPAVEIKERADSMEVDLQKGTKRAKKRQAGPFKKKIKS